MINVNLLPESKLQGLKERRLKNTTLSISTLVILVSIGLPVALFVSDFLLMSAINSRQSKIDDLVTEFENQDDVQEILTVQSQLDSLPEVEDQKYYMSNLLALIEHATPSNVSVTSVSAINEDGTFSFQANARTILEANEFIDTLEAIEIVQTTDGDELVSISPFGAPLIRSFSDDASDPVSFSIEGELNSEFGNVADINEFVLNPVKLELKADSGKKIENQTAEND